MSLSRLFWMQWRNKQVWICCIIHKCLKECLQCRLMRKMRNGRSHLSWFLILRDLIMWWRTALWWFAKCRRKNGKTVFAVWLLIRIENRFPEPVLLLKVLVQVLQQTLKVSLRWMWKMTKWLWRSLLSEWKNKHFRWMLPVRRCLK